MQKEVLLDMVFQNRFTTLMTLQKITNENASYKLNKSTASAGFIYRHIGELINLFGGFFGIISDVENTTMGKTDEGQGSDIQESKALVDRGFEMLNKIVETSAESDWMKMVETPFFGNVSRIRLFAHILFHTSHHAGQISLTLARGEKLIPLQQ